MIHVKNYFSKYFSSRLQIKFKIVWTEVLRQYISEHATSECQASHIIERLHNKDIT